MLSLNNKLKAKTKVSSSKMIVLYALLAVLEIVVLFLVIFLARRNAERRVVLLISYIFRFFSMVLATYIVFGRHDKSEYRFLWLLLLVIEPISGSLFYLIFGEKKPKSFKRYALPDLGFDHKSLEEFKIHTSTIEHGRVFKNLESTYSQMLLDGNKVEFYMPCDGVENTLIESIKNAKEYVLLQTFIMTSGKFLSEILDALEENKAPRVYFYLDDFGTFLSLSHSDITRMRRRGIEIIRFNRINLIFRSSFNYRCHKKMIVIDGKVAFIGGMNIADEYLNKKNRFGNWMDCVLMIKGPSVLPMQESFANDWYNETKKIIPLNWNPSSCKDKFSGVGIQFFASNPISRSNSPIETVILSLILSAKKSIKIISPYLSITNNVYNALVFAKNCGVDIGIIIPGIADKGFVYIETLQVAERLSKSGINIKIYTKGFSHAKLIIIDDDLVNLSSVNFDYRSFYLSSEAGVNIYNKQVADVCAESYEKLLGDCTEPNFGPRTFSSRLKGWFAHLCRSYF